jgi:hypothetical protein
MRCFPALKRCNSSSPLRRFPPNRQRTANLPPAIAVECLASGNPLQEPRDFHWQPPLPSLWTPRCSSPGDWSCFGRTQRMLVPRFIQGSGLQGTARRAPWPLLRSRYIPLRMPQPLRSLRSAAVAESFWYGWVRDPPPFASRFLIQPAKIS